MRRIAALTTKPGHDRAGRDRSPSPAAPRRRRRTAPPISASMARVPQRRARRRTSPSMSATASSSIPTRPRSAPTPRRRWPRQAQWLNQYTQLCHRHRRPCRRARHARIQSGARRPPCRRHPRLPDRRGCRRQPPEDDLLRQGTSGRGLRRHLLLVAEPPRGHHAQRRRRQLSALSVITHPCERRPQRPPFCILDAAGKQNLAEVCGSC